MEQVTINLEEYKALIEANVLMQNGARVLENDPKKLYTGEEIAAIFGIEL